MACEDLENKLDSLIELRKETIEDLHRPGLSPQERAALLQTLKRLGAQISGTQLALNACLHPPAPPVKAPQNILEIKYTNPVPPTDPNWATSAGGTFPENSKLEWKQVLAPEDDYDQFTLVGASGWVLDPKISGADLPFSHPFGRDWEFELALDDQPQYTPLLSPANQGPEGEGEDPFKAANDLGIPVAGGGFLGVEWDSGHVPASFRNNVHEGDRVAVFGRWILDCGHDVQGNFRTEIHPPLLMATGSLQKQADGSQATRVLLTSRPYLMAQVYTTDTNDIYQDNAEDDGGFYDHLLHEVIKINEHRSFLVEAHPKVKSHPFLGAHLLRLTIRPPASGSGPTPINVARQLVVSYQFTVRGGCAVQVTSSGPDSIDVLIALSHGGYTPPPLPHRNGRRYSRDEITALGDEYGQKYIEIEALSAALQAFLPGSLISSALVLALLERGIETDEYDPLKIVNVLDAGHAVRDTLATNIPLGQGILHDDSQPFPIYGWIEARWRSTGVVHP